MDHILQIPVYEKSLPIFSTRTILFAVCITALDSVTSRIVDCAALCANKTIAVSEVCLVSMINVTLFVDPVTYMWPIFMRAYLYVYREVE